MTVQQLIEHLQTFDPELPVILSHTDHTDWTYTWKLSFDDVEKEEDIYLDSDDDDDSDEPDYTEGLVINCTPWE